jgi:hypothetical protein
VSTAIGVLVIAWNDGGGPGWQLALGHVTAVALLACGVLRAAGVLGATERHAGREKGHGGE